VAKLTIVHEKNSESLAPKQLKPATRAWFDQICREYELESQHLRILQLAGEAWDQYQKARMIWPSMEPHSKTNLATLRPIQL